MNRTFSISASDPEAHVEIRQLSCENGIDLYWFSLEHPTLRQPVHPTGMIRIQ